MQGLTETALKMSRLMERLNARFKRPVNNETTTGEENYGNQKNMSDLIENALTIAKYLYANNFIGSRSVSVSTLQGFVGLSNEEFDIADEYLLGDERGLWARTDSQVPRAVGLFKRKR